MQAVASTQSPKLAAILAIDAVGFSRLMHEDEVGTLAALKSVRTGVIDPSVAAYSGRLFKAMGDGFLLEFNSVMNAVECAIDIQQQMLGHNTSKIASQVLEFRMGLNVADIILDQGDVYGDGVNIAVRLEGLAEPSEICVSGAVYEQIRSTLGDLFKPLGPKMLKNIACPVDVYAAHVGKRAKTPLLKRLIPFRRTRQSVVVAGVFALLVAYAGVLVVTGFGSSISLDGNSAAVGTEPGATSGADAAKAGDQAEVARIAAGAETEAAKAKVEASKAKAAAATAEAEADTVSAEAKAKAQVVKRAVKAWKDASLSLTASNEAIRDAETKLAALKGRAVSLDKTRAKATDNNPDIQPVNALDKLIRDAEEYLDRTRVQYEAAAKSEARAKAHMEKVKADAQPAES